MRIKGLKPTVLVLVAGALTVASPALAGDEEALFGKKYHSVSVTKDGEPKPLVKGTHLWVDFRHNDENDGVAWRAGCNYYGAPIELADNILDTGQIVGTEMACIGDGLMRQDRSFVRFFRRDPAWSASGRDLTLNTNRVTIELRRRAK